MCMCTKVAGELPFLFEEEEEEDNNNLYTGRFFVGMLQN